MDFDESELRGSIKNYKNNQKRETGFETAIEEMKDYVDRQRMLIGKQPIKKDDLISLSYKVLSGDITINQIINR